METRPLLIGGEWRTTLSAREVRSPYSSELIARFSVASGAEVDEALGAAARAAAEMRELPRHRVAESLRLMAEGIRVRAEEFARAIALEAGKPVRTARAEVGRAVMTFTHASEEARRFAGEVVPLD
ncbi:MAG TPA: aldehyde dehydrogenase family protein, partial [Pyrinomonadaceae bacterium]